MVVCSTLVTPMPTAAIASFLLSMASAAPSDGWEWRGEAGIQIDPAPHGVVNALARRGPWGIALLTDTLELSYSPSTPSGRWWARLRAQGCAAQLFVSPWRAG